MDGDLALETLAELLAPTFHRRAFMVPSGHYESCPPLTHLITAALPHSSRHEGDKSGK